MLLSVKHQWYNIMYSHTIRLHEHTLCLPHYFYTIQMMVCGWWVLVDVLIAGGKAKSNP